MVIFEISACVKFDLAPGSNVVSTYRYDSISNQYNPINHFIKNPTCTCKNKL